jgi:hydrogenase maturation protease
VARRLRDSLPAAVDVLEREGEPTALIDTWAGAEAVWLVDAVLSGAAPGTVLRLDASRSDPPERLGGGTTHHFSLCESIAVARALGRLPARVVVFGIEGERFDLGEELTPAVAAAVAPVCSAIEEEVRELSAGR